MVVYPCVIAVSMVAMRSVVTHVVFAAETLSVAAVVSDPAVWVHHVWNAHRYHLLRFSSASLAFRSAGDAIPSCSFAHLIAVAR